MKLPPESILLFQGDSITDCNRSRSVHGPNAPDGLGHGFVNHIASRLLAEHPNDHLLIFNRGVSGNRSEDMLARWDDDTLKLKPTHISVLIGVNDSWHQDNPVNLQRYEAVLELMVRKTEAALPGVKWIFCEPFGCTSPCFTPEMVREVGERQEIVHKLAKEHKATLVRFGKLFDKASRKTSEQYWLPDGVHPSAGGHYLMAEHWLKAIES